MKFQLKVDYEDGSEVYDLTEKETKMIFKESYITNQIDVNAILRIIKKRHEEFNSGIKGDIKE